mmetsp:Transcript_36067/g.44023  ORF Transcript_36067/g.44023 Transcript_36067/m.44023 type:complete len:102 (-) Transcript_36067:846-1151(-)
MLAADVHQAFSASYVSINFMQWAAEHNRIYQTVEEWERRLAIFSAQFSKIELQNQRQSGLKFALNHMSDWTNEEYESMLGLKNMDDEREEPMFPFTDVSNG